MAKRPLPMSKVYQLLEPGPVLLLTTSRDGRANVMPISWHMMIEFEPPLVGCVLSDRNWSYRTLKDTRECVLNVPTAELAKQVVRCGNTSGKTTDKFAAFGLTPVPGAKVAAPLVDECYANLECQLVDTRLVNQYGMFILEVVAAWVDPAKKNPRTLHHEGHGKFFVAGERISVPSRKR